MNAPLALLLVFNENNEVVQVTGGVVPVPIVDTQNATLTDSVKMLAGAMFDKITDNDSWEG